MSHSHSTAASSNNFQQIFNNALKAYERRTKNDLLAHPLAAQLQACQSPAAVLAILHQQVQELDQSRSSDERWSKWLDPTVNVLFAFSAALGEGVGLVCLSMRICKALRSYYWTGVLARKSDLCRSRSPSIGAYLPSLNPFARAIDMSLISQTAKDVRSSQDVVIDIFERIENFFRRLETYTEVPPTTEMMDISMKILVEVLCILAIATKEIKQSRTSK
jgi:hypothetical protein